LKKDALFVGFGDRHSKTDQQEEKSQTNVLPRHPKIPAPYEIALGGWRAGGNNVYRTVRPGGTHVPRGATISTKGEVGTGKNKKKNGVRREKRSPGGVGETKRSHPAQENEDRKESILEKRPGPGSPRNAAGKKNTPVRMERGITGKGE